MKTELEALKKAIIAEIVPLYPDDFDFVFSESAAGGLVVDVRQTSEVVYEDHVPLLTITHGENYVIGKWLWTPKQYKSLSGAKKHVRELLVGWCEAVRERHAKENAKREQKAKAERTLRELHKVFTESGLKARYSDDSPGISGPSLDVTTPRLGMVFVLSMPYGDEVQTHVAYPYISADAATLKAILPAM